MAIIDNEVYMFFFAKSIGVFYCCFFAFTCFSCLCKLNFLKLDYTKLFQSHVSLFKLYDMCCRIKKKANRF